jgi:predicted nucleotidyltransferase
MVDLDVSRFDVSGYAAGLRTRERARRRAEAERRGRMQRALPAAVEELVQQFGVKKVVLFGSLARGDAGLESDVDLLVDALPPERWFEAMARLSAVLDADVDLVSSGSTPPEVLERALAEGQVLHG